jgi:hypothetical protein
MSAGAAPLSKTGMSISPRSIATDIASGDWTMLNRSESIAGLPKW